MVSSADREAILARAARRRAVNIVLRQLRQDRGLTQRDLARLTGVSQNTVSALERGHGNPTWRTVTRLAEVLGADPKILLGESLDHAS